jgi:hypothetical protein
MKPADTFSLSEQTGRICHHGGHDKSWGIWVAANRLQRHECDQCSQQFTVTTKTRLEPFHLTAIFHLVAGDVSDHHFQQGHCLNGFGKAD